MDSSLDAFARYHGWAEEVLNTDEQLTPNPQTKLQAAEEALQNYITKVVKSYQSNIAAQQAAAQIEAAVSTTTLTLTES